MCGAPLREMAVRDARKIVTVLFCDVTGWTALGEKVDPEVLRRVMDEYFTDARQTIERHGGMVEKFVGDAVMAVFGVPCLHEDDALRAVRAAAEIRERLPRLAEDMGVALRFRTGVNTGPVLVREGENVAVGDAVNVAARLEQAAAPGEIILGAETLRLVRDAVEVEAMEPLVLKGKSEPVAAFRLLGVDPDAPGVARRLDVPLVGRTRELRLLRDTWARTVEESTCQLFTVLGPAGVGKSRLISELFAGLGGAATLLQGRCPPYGEGITFRPLVEALASAGDSANAVIERLRIGGAATPEELFWTVRRLLESLAVERPVVLQVDDLQWAEPMLLDLLEHIAELSHGAPILLLCAARPWLLEERPGWAEGKSNASTVRLEPLDASECRALLAEFGDGLAPDAQARIISASQGNPLFLQEMVALAREQGTLNVPSTIQVLLAARLERLARVEREILERGAVEGEVFHNVSVRVLAGEPIASEVDPRLVELVRKELVHPHATVLSGADAFRFRHLLLRDAAYDALTKETRAALHERFGRWLERSAEWPSELAALAGWHLEQAVRYRKELNQSVDPTLVCDAAQHLYLAGRRARERSDAAAAKKLFERALALAPGERQLHRSIAIDLAEQLVELGDLRRADELLSAAETEPAGAGAAALTRFEWLIRVKPHAATRLIESRLPEMLAHLARTGDERGIAKAHMAAFWVHMLASRPAAAGIEARLAAVHALNAGDKGLRSWALGWYIVTMVYGRQDRETIKRELDLIEEEELGPYLAARVDFGRGELARLEGRFEDARRLTNRAIEGFQALGIPALDACGQQELARTELSAGVPCAALPPLLQSDAILSGLGERLFRSATQALVAQAQERLANREEALAALALADQLSVPGDVLTYVIADGVRARLALADGDRDAAERWARSAVAHASQSDYLAFEASAKLDLARVLRAQGRSEPAAAEAQAALNLFLEKGDRPGAVGARSLLDELSIPA